MGFELLDFQIQQLGFEDGHAVEAPFDGGAFFDELELDASGGTEGVVITLAMGEVEIGILARVSRCGLTCM